MSLPAPSLNGERKSPVPPATAGESCHLRLLGCDLREHGRGACRARLRLLIAGEEMTVVGAATGPIAAVAEALATVTGGVAMEVVALRLVGPVDDVTGACAVEVTVGTAQGTATVRAAGADLVAAGAEALVAAHNALLAGSPSP